MTNETELKVCPYCGSNDIRCFETTTTINHETIHHLAYYCNKCYCSDPKFLSFQEEQQKLMNEWFDGKYIIKINTNEECDKFINYIRMYDLRFIDRCNPYKDFPIFFVWRYCDSLHHHQLEYSTTENYFKGKIIDYFKINYYIEDMGKLNTLYYDFSSTYNNLKEKQSGGIITMFDKNLVYKNELCKIYTTSMCESLTKYCTCSMDNKPPLRDYKVYICEPKDGSGPKFVLFNEQGEPIAESTGFDSMGVEIEKLRFLKGVKHEK